MFLLLRYKMLFDLSYFINRQGSGQFIEFNNLWGKLRYKNRLSLLHPSQLLRLFH